MLKITKMICALIIIVLSGYQLISSNFQFMPYTILLVGIMMTVIGIEEFRKQHQSMGSILICTAVFVFFVSTQTLLF